MTESTICIFMFVILCFLGALLILMGSYFIYQDLVYLIEWELLMMSSSEIVMTMILDWMSLMFMGFVFLISSLVILYSEGYMEGERYLIRFIILVVLFVGSMALLIISPNLISILLGWDGLGLISYCLVIYYQNSKSYNAGMITFLSNRIGDVALLTSIAWMLNYGSWNFVYYVDMVKEGDWVMGLIMGFVMLAAMTKSAQIPFSSWLPAAMAAPTPVSALVHSSTLVTAGVYLMIRFNNLLMEMGWGKWLLLIASMTMFMAGLGAMFEYDLKKIIALSTLSQLGLMMGILSMGFWHMAFFHLLTHAFFKALLFMCAGSLIHNVKDTQDIRMLGGLSCEMPITCACLNIANLSLCGGPFLSGFYSKDLILEMMILSVSNLLIWGLFIFSTMLTAMYSFRLFYYSMLMENSFNVYSSLTDKSKYMLSGMLGLLSIAVSGGCMLSWAIYPSPESVSLPIGLKILALGVSLIGAWVGTQSPWMTYYKASGQTNAGLWMKHYLGGMWFMPILSTKGMGVYFLKTGEEVLGGVDCGWAEYLTGQGVYNSFISMMKWLDEMSLEGLKGYLMLFFCWLLVGVSLIMIY
uniref:NADH-ubiquinone oxidoreductase chain 5 n=2 Tax=Ellipes minuta TaxID=241046 RepID=E0YCG8_9ORTH|nr:NADH dehydrogenase subunit 5 [Ellipes minuta]ADD97003.1 NADH dehydrogenase subunit 5 [Ellipes minuta]